VSGATGPVAFTTLLVLFSRPTTDRASLAISLSLIGLLTPLPPRAGKVRVAVVQEPCMRSLLSPSRKGIMRRQ
jgi:hypothetical protein